MSHCLYYQAYINRKKSWFFVAVLRSFEHLAFDRTIDKGESLFEFFVSPSEKLFFEKLMKDLHQLEVVIDFYETKNRLISM